MGGWVLDFARLRLSQPSLVKLKLGLSLAKIELFYFFLFFIDGSEKTRLSSIVSQPKKVVFVVVVDVVFVFVCVFVLIVVVVFVV